MLTKIGVKYYDKYDRDKKVAFLRSFSFNIYSFLHKGYIFVKNIIKMREDLLSYTLKEEAVLLGLCKEWKDDWKDNTSQQGLINKYFKGLDFPMKYHWPSNKFIKEHFEIGILRKNNILVDDKRSLLNPKEAVILGHTDATVRVNGSNNSSIYVRDNSRVEIIVRNSAFVIVHLFEKAHINVKAFDNPNVLVLKHSDDVSIASIGSIKIKEDFDYLK